jgi:hypothetical protein
MKYSALERYIIVFGVNADFEAKRLCKTAQTDNFLTEELKTDANNLSHISSLESYNGLPQDKGYPSCKGSSRPQITQQHNAVQVAHQASRTTISQPQ